MEQILVYTCEDSPEGIFSAIFDALTGGWNKKNICIEVDMEGVQRNCQLFAKYRIVKVSEQKSEKVLDIIYNKIGLQAYEMLMRSVRSRNLDKGNMIYQFIIDGLYMGSKITKALQIHCVEQIFQMDREIGIEVHHYQGFLRFQEIRKEPAVLMAVFEPKNQILPLMLSHFSDRLNGEWFVIFDKRHGEAAFHEPQKKTYIRKLVGEERKIFEGWKEQEQSYEDLWQIFFKTIAIPERDNAKLQRNNMPLRYRDYMTEFQKQKENN